MADASDDIGYDIELDSSSKSSSSSSSNFNSGSGSAPAAPTPSTTLSTSLMRTMQNSMIYGYRIRFIHTFAYHVARTRKPQQLLSGIWDSMRMGVKHGTALSLFAAVYRIVGTIFNGNAGIAGFAAGSLVYGGALFPQSVVDDGICVQVTLYAVGRVIVGLGRLFARRFALSKRQRRAVWVVFVGIVWAAVMAMQDTAGAGILPSGLASSLRYMYGERAARWLEMVQY
jgi:peroxisomal membrane protein 4